MLLSELPAANAIKIGSLYFKSRDLESHLARSVRLIVLEDPSMPTYLGRSGSSTLIRYRDRLLVVTTRHELGIGSGREPDRSALDAVRVASPEDGILKNIPTNAAHHETSNPTEEFHDLLFLSVYRGWDQWSAQRPDFFQLEPFANEQRHASFFLGHPTVDGVMAYDPPAVNLKTAIKDCSFEPTFHSAADYLRSYSYEPADYHVDGLSGGAVFSLVGERKNWRVVLDGIIVRAGAGHLYVIDADYLIAALKTM